MSKSDTPEKNLIPKSAIRTMAEEPVRRLGFLTEIQVPEDFNRMEEAKIQDLLGSA